MFDRLLGQNTISFVMNRTDTDLIYMEYVTNTYLIDYIRIDHIHIDHIQSNRSFGPSQHYLLITNLTNL